MHKFGTAAAVVTLGLALAGSAQAYSVSFGEDLNGSSTLALTNTPNASAAATQFLGKLSGVQTEDFETRSGSAPLALQFSGSGSLPLTASLEGGGSVATNTDPLSGGRYSAPGGTKYWSTTSDSFTIKFDTDIAAFGFYGIDIGDFDGSVSIDFLDASGQVIKNEAIGTTAYSADLAAQGLAQRTDGAVLFFGAVASNQSEFFRSVRFVTNSNRGVDTFAFDNFTIGDGCQVKGGALCVTTPPNPTPEPGTLALAGLALLGLRAARRRA